MPVVTDKLCSKNTCLTKATNKPTKPSALCLAFWAKKIGIGSEGGTLYEGSKTLEFFFSLPPPPPPPPLNQCSDLLCLRSSRYNYNASTKYCLFSFFFFSFFSSFFQPPPPPHSPAIQPKKLKILFCGYYMYRLVSHINNTLFFR